MPNTEKPMNQNEKKRQGIVETSKKRKQQPIKTLVKQEPEKKEVSSESIIEDKTKESEEKEKLPLKPKIKKSETVVKGRNLPISTKKSSAICRFIKRKKIIEAINDLEQVLAKKRAVPMKGEIPHKKSVKGIASGSGGYPKNATEHFIKLLKSLQANADANSLEEPIILEAFANIGERPYGRFGTVRRKRTHVTIISRDREFIKKIKRNK